MGVHGSEIFHREQPWSFQRNNSIETCLLLPDDYYSGKNHLIYLNFAISRGVARLKLHRYWRWVTRLRPPTDLFHQNPYQ